MAERFGRQRDGEGRDEDGHTDRFSREGGQALRQEYNGTNAREALRRAEDDDKGYGAVRTGADEHGNHNRRDP